MDNPKSKNILIFEKNPIIAHDMCNMAKNSNHTAAYCTSIYSLLERISFENFDLIVSNRVDWTEALSSQKSQVVNKIKETPTLIVSANLELDFNVFQPKNIQVLLKPFTSFQFVSKLYNILNI